MAEIVTLPSIEEMRLQLANMDNVPDYEKNYLHPLLLREAGRSLTPSSVMSRLVIAMNAIAPQTTPREWNIMLHGVDRYVKVFVDSESMQKKIMHYRLPV